MGGVVGWEGAGPAMASSLFLLFLLQPRGSEGSGIFAPPLCPCPPGGSQEQSQGRELASQCCLKSIEMLVTPSHMSWWFKGQFKALSWFPKG